MLAVFKDNFFHYTMSRCLKGQRLYKLWYNKIKQISISGGSLTLIYTDDNGILKQEESEIHFNDLTDIDLFTELKSISINDFRGKLFAHKWGGKIESIRLENVHHARELLAMLDRFPLLKMLTIMSHEAIFSLGIPAQLKERLAYLKTDALREWAVIEGCNTLEALDLSGANELTFADMPQMPGTKKLWVKGYSGAALDGITSMPNLEIVSLKNGNIVNLSAITGLSKLTGLILENNNIYDLSPLSNMKELEMLIVSDNMLEDLSPLRDMKLKHLVLNHNPISSLESLAGNESLEALFINDTWVKDISPLVSCKNLKQLSLDIKSLADIKQLKQLSFVPYINGAPYLEVVRALSIE